MLWLNLSGSQKVPKAVNVALVSQRLKTAIKKMGKRRLNEGMWVHEQHIHLVEIHFMLVISAELPPRLQ